MKITLIHGQSHKGSTYHVARILAEKIDGEITETWRDTVPETVCEKLVCIWEQ